MVISKAMVVAFEAFWNVYPKRPDNPKAAARLVFERRVREGADPTVIVAAAGRYAVFVEVMKVDSPFIPHARTWLSQRRWEDYPEPPAAPAPRETAVHPLGWLGAVIGADAFASWVAPTSVQVDDTSVVIAAPTLLAMNHVLRLWGRLIEAHYPGRAVALTVQTKDADHAR